MIKIKNRKYGFTLVELLVVVAILGILSTIGIVSFGGFLGSAKQKTSVSNHSLVIKTIESVWLECILNADGKAKNIVNTKGYPTEVTCIDQNSWEHVFHNHFEGKKFINPYNKNNLAVTMDYNNNFPTSLGTTNIRYFHDKTNPSNRYITIKTRWGAGDDETSSKIIYYE